MPEGPGHIRKKGGKRRRRRRRKLPRSAQPARSLTQPRLRLARSCEVNLYERTPHPRNFEHVRFAEADRDKSACKQHVLTYTHIHIHAIIHIRRTSYAQSCADVRLSSKARPSRLKSAHISLLRGPRGGRSSGPRRRLLLRSIVIIIIIHFACPFFALSSLYTSVIPTRHRVPDVISAKGRKP